MNFHAIKYLHQIKTLINDLDSEKSGAENTYEKMRDFFQILFHHSRDINDFNIFNVIKWYFTPMMNDPRLIVSSWTLGLFFRTYEYYKSMSNEKNTLSVFFDSLFPEDSNQSKKTMRLKSYLQKIYDTLNNLDAFFAGDQKNQGKPILSETAINRLYQGDLGEYIDVIQMLSVMNLLGTYLKLDSIFTGGSKKCLGSLYKSALERNHTEYSVYTRVGYFPDIDHTQLIKKIKKIYFNLFKSLSVQNFLFQMMDQADEYTLSPEKELFTSSQLIESQLTLNSMFLIQRKAYGYDDQHVSDQETFFKARREFFIHCIKDQPFNAKAIAFIMHADLTQKDLDEGAVLIKQYDLLNPYIIPILVSFLTDIYNIYSRERSLNDPCNYISLLNIEDGRLKDWFTYLHLEYDSNSQAEMSLKLDKKDNKLVLGNNEITNLYLDFLVGKRIQAMVMNEIEKNTETKTDKIEEMSKWMKNFNRTLTYNFKSSFLNQEQKNVFVQGLYNKQFEFILEDIWRMIDIIKKDIREESIHTQLVKTLHLKTGQEKHSLMKVVKDQYICFSEGFFDSQKRQLFDFFIALLFASFQKISELKVEKTDLNNHGYLTGHKPCSSSKGTASDHNSLTIFDKVIAEKILKDLLIIFENNDSSGQMQAMKNVLKRNFYYILKGTFTWYKDKGNPFENFFLCIQEKFGNEEKWSDEFSGKILLINTTIMNYKRDGFMRNKTPHEDVEICKGLLTNINNLRTLIENDESVPLIRKSNCFEFLDIYSLYFKKLLEEMELIIELEERSYSDDDNSPGFSADEEEILRKITKFCEEFGISKEKSSLFKWIEERDEEKYYIGKQNRMLLYLPIPIILGIVSIFGLTGLFVKNESIIALIANTEASVLNLSASILSGILSFIYIFTQILKSKKVRFFKAFTRTLTLYFSFITLTYFFVFIIMCVNNVSAWTLFPLLILIICMNWMVMRFFAGYTEWSLNTNNTDESPTDESPKESPRLRGEYLTKISMFLMLAFIYFLVLIIYREKAKNILSLYMISNYVLFLSLATQLFFTGRRMMVRLNYSDDGLIFGLFKNQKRKSKGSFWEKELSFYSKSNEKVQTIYEKMVAATKRVVFFHREKTPKANNLEIMLMIILLIVAIWLPIFDNITLTLIVCLLFVFNICKNPKIDRQTCDFLLLLSVGILLFFLYNLGGIDPIYRWLYFFSLVFLSIGIVDLFKNNSKKNKRWFPLSFIVLIPFTLGLYGVDTSAISVFLKFVLSIMISFLVLCVSILDFLKIVQADARKKTLAVIVGLVILSSWFLNLFMMGLFQYHISHDILHIINMTTIIYLIGGLLFKSDRFQGLQKLRDFSYWLVFLGSSFAAISFFSAIPSLTHMRFIGFSILSLELIPLFDALFSRREEPTKKSRFDIFSERITDFFRNNL